MTQAPPDEAQTTIDGPSPMAPVALGSQTACSVCDETDLLWTDLGDGPGLYEREQTSASTSRLKRHQCEGRWRYRVWTKDGEAREYQTMERAVAAQEKLDAGTVSKLQRTALAWIDLD
jgi:hypothetical protein